MIDILRKAASEAGEKLLFYFQKELKTTEKTSHQDLVTKADLEAQKIIEECINALMVEKGFNKHEIGFIGEESLNTKGKHLFIIDPLDGTNNFASGFNYFCVSIAYLYDGILTAGLIYQPYTNTYFFAEKNKGAYRVTGKERINMRIKYTDLKDSLIATYITSNPSLLNKIVSAILKLNIVSRGIRILGSCCLDLMHFSDNANNINVMIHANPRIWDIAAAKLIIEESGGVMTDWKGKPTLLDLDTPSRSYQVLVCHPDNLKKLISHING